MKCGIHWLVIGVLAAGVSAAGDSGSVGAALKQVSKATKGVRGIVAEVEYTETVGKRTINGSGKLYVSFDGSVRAEVGGDAPRTLIFTPPYLYIHRESFRVARATDLVRDTSVFWCEGSCGSTRLRLRSWPT